MLRSLPDTGIQVVSTATDGGDIELSLQRVSLTEPRDHEVTIRVGAAPINPSDLGPMLGPGDVLRMRVAGNGENTVVSLPVPESAQSALSPRLGKAVGTGHEGSGIVGQPGVIRMRRH